MFPATKRLSFVCLLFPLLWKAGAQLDVDCEDRKVCSECITTDSRCMWCADEGLMRGARCRTMLTNCDNILDPSSDIDSQTISDPSISPERYEISLRSGDTLSLPIDITTQRNIPLDLYILFDLSQSLQEEIEATRQVSSQILDSLQGITDNAKVGVGSFIDKTFRPYTRVTLEGECENRCYNFRHYQRLTSDSAELDNSLSIVQTGSNIDAPEAGLDALAQIALCDEYVGWRDDAVKLILYFTDDAFKFAGEGRFAGIMKPFEDVCKLVADPQSTDYLVYTGNDNDYTSPGQLLRLLEKFNINPVFIAVTSDTQISGNYNVLRTHEVLADMFNIRLNDGASAAELDSINRDTDEVAANVLRIIDEQVLIILRRTRLVPEGFEGLSFTVEAECPPGAQRIGVGTNSQSCTEVDVGNTTKFTLNLTLEDCGTFGSEPRELPVAVFPLGSVTILINPICECSCDGDEVNSGRCNFNGNYTCGECVCEEGYCGLQCQIKETDQNECPRGVDNEFCSGARGTCLTCECVCETNLTAVIDNERLQRPGVNATSFGLACECDFFSCLDESNSSDTVVCSGRGMCCNGMCICDENEDGFRYRNRDSRDCDCEPAEVVCLETGTTEICGGRGECGCEKCTCPVPYDPRGYCNNVTLNECYDIGLEPEVERCILDEKERNGQDRRQCQICQFSVINVVNISCVLLIPENEQPTTTNDAELERDIERFAARNLPGDNYEFVMGCEFTDEDQCIHEYYLLYNTDDINELVYVAEEQRSCPEAETDPLLSIPLWSLAVILLVALLLLGLVLLIIIKVIFMVLDYFEVKRLEKEVGMADFSKNQNPLYQSPDVEYKNVAYGKE